MPQKGCGSPISSVLLFCTLLAQCADENGQSDGHANGNTEGHHDGHTDGHTNGHTNGRTDGHTDADHSPTIETNFAQRGVW